MAERRKGRGDPTDPAESGSYEKEGGVMLSVQRETELGARVALGGRGGGSSQCGSVGGTMGKSRRRSRGNGAGKASEACFPSRKEPCAGCKVT